MMPKTAGTAPGEPLSRCTSNCALRYTSASNHVSEQNSYRWCPAASRVDNEFRRRGGSKLTAVNRRLSRSPKPCRFLECGTRLRDEDEGDEPGADLIVVEDVLDELAFSPHPTACAEFFKTEETVATALRAHEQDIVRIENLPRTSERPALRRRLLKLVEARVDPVAAQLKRQCQHFVAMFVTVMAVTDKGARHGRATAQAVAEVILSAWSAISNYLESVPHFGPIDDFNHNMMYLETDF